MQKMQMQIFILFCLIIPSGTYFKHWLHNLIPLLFLSYIRKCKSNLLLLSNLVPVTIVSARSRIYVSVVYRTDFLFSFYVTYYYSMKILYFHIFWVLLLNLLIFWHKKIFNPFFQHVTPGLFISKLKLL